MKNSHFKKCMSVPFFLLIAGCSDMQESRFFSTTAEFKKSDVFNNWVPDIIPEGAEKIDVWYDSDANDVQVEFIYRGNRPLESVNMKLLDASLKSIAVSSYPKLENSAQITSIQYRCDRRVIELESSPKKSVTYFEVDFVGDTGEKVYYWNTHLDKTYKKICK
jgi:hypothetical protein